MSNPFVVLVAQAFVIVATARVLGRLTRTLRQPLVIAEIVAGIVLGPSVLGALAPTVEAALFPKASLSVLNLTSQLGLLLFMFIIGLELHPDLLKGRARSTVAISHASIVLPFTIGAVLAGFAHGWLAPPNVARSSFILFMGAAMSVTAFPVLARILVERRLLRSKIGAIAISCAAIDDVTAWCVLAFVVSIVRAASLLEALRIVAFALLYITAMLWLVRPFLERLARRTSVGLTQNFVAVILLCVLASSWLTELIGIHALFGAFLFGAIMPKNGTLAAALTEKIEDVVMVLLLPLFFAYSGLRTQIGLLDTPGAWITCFAIILAASLGKFGGSAIAARLTGLSWREASAIGVLMNTRGLMELIVLNIGLDLGVLSPRVFTMMVLMALVTTFITTPILEMIYPSERFAREQLEADDTSSSQASRPFTIVACVFDEMSAPGLVTVGVAVAGVRPVDSRLYGLRLTPPTERSSALLASRTGEEESELRADAVVDAARTRARILGAQLRQISLVSSDPVSDVCAVADVKQADLVLLGWRKGDTPQEVTGGVLSLTRSNVAVLVDRGLAVIKRVLVPFTDSPNDREALSLAGRIVSNTDGQLTVIVVAPGDPARSRQRLERAAFELLSGVDRNRVTLVTGDEASATQALAARSREDCDLVLMSAAPWGLEPSSFSLGLEQMLDKIACSVVLVRARPREGAAPAATAEHVEGSTRYKTAPPAA